MLTRLSNLFGGLPIAAVVLILAVLLVQIGLQIFSLIDLAKRPRVPGGRKWVWVLVIVAGNLVGAVLYLALGRSRPAPASDAVADSGAEARQRALDRLYGDRDRR